MAGTLVANTINTDTGLFSTQNAYQGIAKAWVNFAGATGTIRSSFNCSSVTRVTTGQYTMNLTTAMSSADFVITGTCGSGNTYGNYALANRGQGSNTTTTATFNTYITHTTTLADCDLTTVAIFGA